ncbi:MAG: hypothetical protein SAJ12_03630 [Jaaginema sp. PMC 1079.18]|nr:hypothetical protein [Jaaginema sp. PMC 1080.18]MEC4850079.1 hypothetical protein [Jaaginema sp. PMC 1079.18]MEC4867560.1 hypothetical protein [Jaaginema sp. PMC 1078.18]
MTTTPEREREPNLTDVIEKLESLSTRVDKLSGRVDNLSDRVDNISTEMRRFDERFGDYQKATQWVVQLAFTLIASATITVIITSVVR